MANTAATVDVAAHGTTGSQEEESEKKTTTRKTTVGSVWTPKVVWMLCTLILAHRAVSVVWTY